MNKELIKQAFVEGYKAGMEKGASPAMAAALLAAALHTVPGVVASRGSNSVQKDPDKYWNKGMKYTGGGLVAQILGRGMMYSHNPYLAALGALVGGGGGLATAYGTNAAIASALVKRRNAKR